MPDRGRTPLPRALWFLVGALLAAKAWLIAHHASAPQIWYDELFYFSAGYDIAHWGQRGVPHPQFFFYPPLVSLLSVPWHFLAQVLGPLGVDLSMTHIYQLSLLTLSAATATAVVSSYRLVEELFGERSLGIAFVVALSSPAYLGLHFMSEGLFLALYSAHLVCLARFVLRGRPRDAALAGLLTAAMIWTRPNGILVAVASLLAPLLAGGSPRAVGRSRLGHWLRTSAAYAWLLLPPLAARAAWSALAERFADPANWNLGAATYARAAWGFLQDGPAEFLLLAHRIAANGAYVVLGTLGLAVPLVLYAITRRPRSEPAAADDPPNARADEAARRHHALRVVLVCVVAFGGLAAAAGAVHMRYYGGVDPQYAKYLLYGRYVEYLIVPLLALGAGALTSWRRDATMRDRVLVGLAVAGGVGVSLALLPDLLFHQLVGRWTLRSPPNHHALTWVLWLWRTLSGSAATWLVAVAAAVVPAVLWTVCGRTVLGQTPLGRTVPGTMRGLAAALSAVPLLITLVFVAQFHRDSDSRWRAERARLSAQLAEVRDRWPDGLCIEWHPGDKNPSQNAPIWVAYFDHLEHVLVGRCLRIAPDLPLLAHESQGRDLIFGPRLPGRRRFTVRLYAPVETPSEPPPSVFTDGFESGDLRQWHRNAGAP